MTSPVNISPDRGEEAILRGASVKAQPFYLEPRKPVVRNPAKVVALVAHAAAEESQQGYKAGWSAGHKEGLDAGRREGEAAARAEVLGASASIVADAATEAAQSATREARVQIEDEAHRAQSKLQERLDRLVASLSQAFDDRLAQSQDDLVALCLEAVTRILGASAARPEHVREAVSQACATLRGGTLLTVELHPEDLVALQQLPQWLEWSREQGRDVQWTASARVESGGCIATSSQGSLDARLDTQLRAFRDLLVQSREETKAVGMAPSTLKAGGT